jgi:hypothetical protein
MQHLEASNSDHHGRPPILVSLCYRRRYRSVACLKTVLQRGLYLMKKLELPDMTYMISSFWTSQELVQQFQAHMHKHMHTHTPCVHLVYPPIGRFFLFGSCGVVACALPGMTARWFRSAFSPLPEPHPSPLLEATDTSRSNMEAGSLCLREQPTIQAWTLSRFRPNAITCRKITDWGDKHEWSICMASTHAEVDVSCWIWNCLDPAHVVNSATSRVAKHPELAATPRAAALPTPSTLECAMRSERSVDAKGTAAGTAAAGTLDWACCLGHGQRAV